MLAERIVELEWQEAVPIEANSNQNRNNAPCDQDSEKHSGWQDRTCNQRLNQIKHGITLMVVRICSLRLAFGIFDPMSNLNLLPRMATTVVRWGAGFVLF